MKTVIELLKAYEESVSIENLALADKLWSDDAKVSFIHPRGHEVGKEEVKKAFYVDTMYSRFSERDLQITSYEINEYDDFAVVTFYWQFDAVFADNGEKKHTEGRETQVLKKEDGSWKIVHVHYSNMPVAGEREGF